MARDPPVMAPEPPGVMVPEPVVMVVPEPPVTVGEPPPPLAIPVIAPSTPAIEHDGELWRSITAVAALPVNNCACAIIPNFFGGFCIVHHDLLAPT